VHRQSKCTAGSRSCLSCRGKLDKLH